MVVSYCKFNFLLKWLFIFSVMCGSLDSFLAITKAQQLPISSAKQPDQSNGPIRHFLWPETVAGKWKAAGPAQTRPSNQLQPSIPTEIYAEYGVQQISSRIYVNKSESYTVEVFQLRFPSQAYGLFTFFQRRLLPQQQQFQAGRYLVRVQDTNSRNKTPLENTSDFVTSFLEQQKAQSTLPILAEHVPQTNKVARSEIYILGPQTLAQDKQFSFLAPNFPFQGGTEAISVEYQVGSSQIGLLLTEFQNPQLASDGYTYFQTALKQFTAEQKATLTLNRIGNYVVITSGAPSEQVSPIISEIKYTVKVYWEGNKFSAIPLEFRPPDQVALQEISETASILLRTFYWIGVMLLVAITSGLLTGSCFFYWRRYQRRKLGMDILFSDAGGTIQLQLETSETEAEKRQKRLSN